MGGGIPEGDSLLLAGPSGSGKTVLASQFIAEGLRQGEPGVIAIFEELPSDYIARAAKLGLDFETPQKEGRLKIIYLRPLDLSVDETVHEVINAVKEIGCQARGARLAGRLRDGAGPRLPSRVSANRSTG